jgi:Na+-driven multidrug efflux pump
MRITYATLAVLALSLFIATESLVGLFNLTAPSATLAISVLKVLFVVNAAIWPLAFTLPNVLRASGDVRFTMSVSVASMWVFRGGLSYVLGSWLGLGLHGVWIAMYVDWMCRSTCFAVRFLKGSWKSKHVI